MITLIDSALELAARKTPVFPLKANKRPCQEGAWKDASTDPAVVRRLFSDPTAMLIGVPTGAVVGFDVLDIDPRKGGDIWLRENLHRLPETQTVQTKSGGHHLRYKHVPGMRCSADRIAPGVDIRADGGYAVPWEVHGYPITGTLHADMPDWLVILALRQINPSTPVPNAVDLAPPDAASLLNLITVMPNPADTTRDDYTAVNLAIQGCVRSLEALNLLDDPTPVYDAAAEWSARWDSGTASSFEDERTRWDDDWSLRDRDISGWKHLIGMAERFGADVSSFRLADVAAEFGDVPDEPESAVETPPAAAPAATAKPARGIPDQPSVQEPTEDGTALGFAADMRDTILYDHSAGAWVLWDLVNGVWRRDDTSRGFATVRAYCAQVRVLFGGGDKSLASASFCGAVERLAKADQRLAVSSAVWDTDPWAIGVPGGVVDLRTGVMRSADPALRMSKQTAVAPAEPGTPSPLWLAFLASATGNDSTLIAYLQRLVGYCLTGDISEEILAFPYGQGGTGKGTLFGTVAAVVGSYALQMPIETFSANSRQNQEYARARMLGARLVMASETPRGAGWDESALKEFSGNEGTISAREPYGKLFNYRPQFKIVILGNHAPSLRGRDSAMERRLHVIPFDHKPAVRDTTLKERLRAEYPAILRWVIDGCLAWQRDGLGTCPAVEAASRVYFEEQDALTAWSNERLDIGAGHKERRTALFSDFAQWARANGEKALSAAEFYEQVRQSLGLIATKDASGVRYLRGAAIRGEMSAMPAADVSEIKALLH